MNDTSNKQVPFFSRSVLNLLKTTLDKEIDELLLQARAIDAELRLRREALSSLTALSADSTADADDAIAKVVAIVFSQNSDILPLREIHEQYGNFSEAIDKKELSDHLRANKGILYEVVGERASAKWKIIKRNESVHE